MDIPIKTWSHHNTTGSLAAVIEDILERSNREYLKNIFTPFTSHEHRLEFVAKIKKVAYINDSKATNVHATWYALESIPAHIIWIAGGVNTNQCYEKLKTLAEKKVKALILLGNNNQLIKTSLGTAVPRLFETYSMKSAVQLAYSLAEAGDTVLLSPACPSFDLFLNYKERGKAFKKCVLEL
jgi:UDP-N-acetylmuramoylalanine--D-glutamate ligase